MISQQQKHYNKIYMPVNSSEGNGVLAPSFITLFENEYRFLKAGTLNDTYKIQFRPHLQQACLSVWDNQLYLLTTDGSRLHMVQVNQDKAQAFFDAGGNKGINSLYSFNNINIIPAKKTVDDQGNETVIPAHRDPRGIGMVYEQQHKWTSWEYVIPKVETLKPVEFDFRLNDYAIFKDGHVLEWKFYEQALAVGKLISIESSGSYNKPLWFTFRGGNHALIMPLNPKNMHFGNKNLEILGKLGYDYTKGK